MFGYVRPRRDLLTPAERETYEAAYCGLCRALGKGCGFPARFLVSYDMTFLYLLRQGLAGPAPTARCWCPARVCGRKPCALDPAGYETVTACGVILAYEKLRDDLWDEGFFRSLPARLLCLVYRRAYRKAARRLPAFAALTARQLRVLGELEAADSPSIDAAADAFAKIVAGCAGDLEDPALGRPLEQLLYHTGRFLYLTDALDDLAEDCRRDRYNPLRRRFRVTEGRLAEADLDYLAQLTDSSVNLAGSALSLLPLRANEGLLENVIYRGFPAVFQAVRQGRFNARDKLRMKPEKRPPEAADSEPVQKEINNR